MACTTTVRAAEMYWSRKEGVIDSAAAMLSKPSRGSSRGSRLDASTSMPSRSCTALAYSLRLSRCRPTWPGSSCSLPASSRLPSIQETSAARVVLSGTLWPPGGICWLRSLRTTFSKTSMFWGMSRLGHGVEGNATGPVVGVVALGAVGAKQLPARLGRAMGGIAGAGTPAGPRRVPAPQPAPRRSQSPRQTEGV